MAYFDVQEAKKQLSELIERALHGEEIVITKAGKPVAQLLPIFEKQVAPRVPGNDKGKIIIRPDFDDLLHEFEE
jgi:prevent-host-death family protein